MKILIADDHRLVREGLKSLLSQLEGQLQLVEAWDASTAWAAVRDNPDLEAALIDLNMPGMTGANSIASLKESFPSLPLIVVSAVEDPREIEEILRIGASGYIPKTASAEVMVQAIRLVLAGGQYLPPLLLSPRPQLIDAPAAPEETEQAQPEHALQSRDVHLTQRQQEVLGLLADGLSNKLIAKKLGLTVGTVKSHMVQIFQVLGVRNRTAAVVAAQRFRPRQRPPAAGF